jgi:uncharacterized protein (DUF2141 family)
MKKLLILSTAILLCTFSAFSQYTLQIEITGIKRIKGDIMLQVLDTLEKVIVQEKKPVEGETCLIRFAGLPAGKYAIRYFQDENLNGELDKNKLGIPTEGYGFSNDAYGMFGPKPFRDWLFVIDSDKKLVLKIKY